MSHIQVLTLKEIKPVAFEVFATIYLQRCIAKLSEVFCDFMKMPVNLIMSMVKTSCDLLYIVY